MHEGALDQSIADIRSNNRNCERCDHDDEIATNLILAFAQSLPILLDEFDARRRLIATKVQI
jgi:hypothetical protein